MLMYSVVFDIPRKGGRDVGKYKDTAPRSSVGTAAAE